MNEVSKIYIQVCIMEQPLQHIHYYIYIYYINISSNMFGSNSQILLFFFLLIHLKDHS